MSASHRPRAFAARLDTRNESAPLARHLLRAYLAALPSGDVYSDTAELLLGELFANAVQHSGSSADRLIEIRFALIGSRLRLEVHDSGSRRPPSAPPAPTTSTAGASSSSTSSPNAGAAAPALAVSASSSGP
ncbi:ATP-binding protein [Kitasatospora sp. NPDC056327]|uniref:ATP-binding protein n=1 Tax=Kitasatospora sp. NPDC056327 TaxID=3345785 RepID=UPI0035DE902C